MKRKVIRVSAETDEAIRNYAKERGIPLADAADKLVNVAVGRLRALRRHQSKKEGSHAANHASP